jgi:hypothetical protein
MYMVAAAATAARMIAWTTALGATHAASPPDANLFVINATAAAEYNATAPSTAVGWMRRIASAPLASPHSPWHQSVYWSSDRHGPTHRVLARAAAGECITIATVGGSSSADMENYGPFLAAGLRAMLLEHGNTQTACVRTVNPSQGGSGTDWGSAFLFSLIPPETDVLLWEFAINDWSPADLSHSNVTARAAHQQLIELWIRRALALNPHMVLGFLDLWKTGAASCWPHCVHAEVIFHEQVGLT